MLKIRGLNLYVSSPQDTRFFKTGESDSTGGKTVSWAVFTYTSGRLEIVSSSEIEVAAKKLSSVFSGEVLFTRAAGNLTTPNAEYSPRQNVTDTVAGVIRTVYEPDASNIGSGQLTLDGDLSATTMTRIPVSRLPIQAELPAWAIPVGVGGIGMVTAGAVVVYRRLHSPQEYLRRAHDALRHGREAEAIIWVEKACEADEHDYDTRSWAALLHWRIAEGEQDAEKRKMHQERALVWMERASEAAPADEGRPDYGLASMVIQAGRERAAPDAELHAAALELVASALSRSPWLADEIEHDDLLRDLRGPQMDTLLARAREQLHSP